MTTHPIIAKLSTVMDHADELSAIVAQKNLSVDDTPYAILGKIFETPFVSVVHYVISLSREDLRTFLHVTMEPGLLAPSRRSLTWMRARMVIHLIELLPRHMLPKDKDDLLAMRTIVNMWPWGAHLLIKQIEIYRSFKEAAEPIEKYTVLLLQHLKRHHLPVVSGRRLLYASLRTVLETLKKLEDVVEDDLLTSLKASGWTPLSTWDSTGELRYGRYCFEEISTIREMIDLSRRFNNCLKQRVALALDGERRYFRVMRGKNLVAFLEIEQDDMCNWLLGDLVDQSNDEIGNTTLRKYSHELVTRFNNRAEYPVVKRTNAGSEYRNVALAATMVGLAGHIQQRKQSTQDRTGNDNRNLGRETPVR